MKVFASFFAVAVVSICLAQPPDFAPPPGGPGRGGFGGVREPTRLLQQFDKNGDKYLNADERKDARAYLATQPQQGRGRGGRGPFGRGGSQEPPVPGPKLTPAEVKQYSSEPLYDAGTLRTLFLEFEDPDWEKELADFYHSDVDVPAKLTVDGKTYSGVGVHFRGASSFMMVPEGRKRSLNLSMNLVHEDQRLGGYRTLNLLNSNGDPIFLRAVLYQQIARQYIPAPKANFLRVVINGESWGIYASVQQFNSELTKEWFRSTKGARWKAPGSPGGRAGLAYLGDDVAAYKRLYEIKTKDDPKAWADLINLCKVLDQTPPEKLEPALKAVLDVEGALKFLALEKALINNDGYWIRASDYNIYQDEKGIFHLIPHDANETFEAPARMMGRGGRGPGGPGGPGFGPPPPRGEQKVDLDPFAGSDDSNKALLFKLLAAPALRARYLGYMKDIAETWLDWNKLGPIATRYHALIAADVARDTRKLYSNEAFLQGLTENVVGQGFGPMSGASIGLKRFVEERREYLLNHPEIKKAAKP